MSAPDISVTWRVRRVQDRAFIAGKPRWAAVAPGCPASAHPHRGCACRIFNSPDAAKAFIVGVTS